MNWHLVWELVKTVGIFSAMMTVVPILVYAERKISADIQDRIGPNRVGPKGILQPIADAIKLLFKEDIIPLSADKVLFVLAPFFAFAPAAVAFCVIPVGNAVEIGGYTMRLQVADLNVGVLFIFAVGAMSVYGIAFGGWASNNKFSLLGGLRSSAQMISYEIPLGLALVSVLMTSGSVSLNEIVLSQTATWGGWLPKWNLFCQPIGFVIFLIAAFAETNRLPFDLPECEPELVGGYHTEYSSMKFSMFFMGEYVAMVVMSSLLVTLFLGGWHFPGMNPASHTILSAILSVCVFSAKVGLILFFFIWVRWTLPRFRYDQLMKLGWQGLVPLAMLNIMVTGAVQTMSR